jgi:hypothetical protein
MEFPTGAAPYRFVYYLNYVISVGITFSASFFAIYYWIPVDKSFDLQRHIL